MEKFKAFTYRFISRILVFTIFVLPLILIAKALYLCYITNNISVLYFLELLISNIPFYGKVFSSNISNECFTLSNESIREINSLIYKNINELMFIGAIASSFSWSLFEVLFSEFFKEHMTIGGVNIQEIKNPPVIKNPLNTINAAMSDNGKGQDCGQEGSSVVGAKEEKPLNNLNTVEGQNTKATTIQPAAKTPLDLETQVFIDILASEVKKDTQNLNQAILTWAEQLKKYRDLPLDQLKLGNGAEEHLIELLRKQSLVLTKYVSNRMSWIESRAVNTLDENRIKIKEIHSQLVEIQNSYLSKVNRISVIKNETIQMKEFYAALNGYRNLVIKEVNKADIIILDDIRGSRLNKYSDLKKAIHADYTTAKKEFNSHDSYLRMKVGEIIKKK